MVTPTGLEPVTSKLGISRSILMSYGAKPAKMWSMLDSLHPSSIYPFCPNSADLKSPVSTRYTSQ